MVRIIFCGDRYWNNIQIIENVVDIIVENISGKFTMISGHAKGADTLSEIVADKRQLPFDGYAADWDSHGKAAGPIRNTRMVVEGRAQAVIAFHDDIGKSRGTANMIHQAVHFQLPYIIIDSKNYPIRHHLYWRTPTDWAKFIEQLITMNAAEQIVIPEGPLPKRRIRR